MRVDKQSDLTNCGDSALTVAAHRTLAEVDRAAWDATLPAARSFYASSPWLAHAEATADAPPVYVTAYQEDMLAASLVAYPLPGDTPYVFSGPTHTVDALHRNVHGTPAPWLAELAPALSCGGRNPAYSTIGTATREHEGRTELVEALLEHAETVAHNEAHACVALPAVAADDEAVRAACESRDFIALPAQSAYGLPLNEVHSLDDYLAGFEQRRRVKIKREMRALEEAGVRYETHALDESVIPRIAPLEMALYAKHSSPADSDAFGSVLSSIAKRVPSAQATLAYVGDQLGGFVLTFEHGGELYARQAGFNYEVQGRLPLYFGLVYYHLVTLAVADGLTAIHYSTGSDQVKRSRGCEEVRQISFVKPLAPDLRERLSDLKEASVDCAKFGR